MDNMNSRKKVFKIIKWIVCILAGIAIVLAIVIGRFTYGLKYKIKDVDSQISSDGVYKINFQEIGAPDFPFGATHARLLLKKGKDTIAEYRFDVGNDGKHIFNDNWSVTWQTDCVKVVIYGEEQRDEEYIMYFDGKTENRQLDTKTDIRRR